MGTIGVKGTGSQRKWFVESLARHTRELEGPRDTTTKGPRMLGHRVGPPDSQVSEPEGSRDTTMKEP
jgi:hypothetical protein